MLILYRVRYFSIDSLVCLLTHLSGNYTGEIIGVLFVVNENKWFLRSFSKHRLSRDHIKEVMPLSHEALGYCTLLCIMPG